MRNMVKFKNMIPARLRRVRQVSPNSEPKYDQNQVMYNLYEQGSVAVHPCEPFETVSGEEISHRMEIDHCVKRAPTLAELMSDRERDRETNVYSVIGSRALLSREVDALTREDFSVQTEQQTISALFSGLCARSDDLARTSRLSKIRNHLNYVGEPELMEAACGIATYWKYRLDAHPDKALFVMLGEINNIERADYAAPQGKIKSDEYFMELIMGEFSDDELSQYANRLLIDEGELVNLPKENVDIIMLDDWTSSGIEIAEQQQCFLRRHPDLRDHIEVQLAIANEERLKVGFRMNGGQYVPVRSYYSANSSSELFSTYIAGSHSSDYSLAFDISSLLGAEDAMPPGVQVARPYHRDDYQTTFRQRLQHARLHGSNVIK
jgi:hypothetical protein